MDDNDLNEMALMRKLKPSKGEVERLESESSLVRQRTEAVVRSAVRGSDISPRVVVQRLGALKPWYTGLLIIVTERFRALCGKNLLRPKHFTAENV